MLHNGLRISLSYRCGYPQSDFAVLADGQPRDIAVFEAENTPWNWRAFWTCRVSSRPSGSSVVPTQLGSA